MLLYYTYEYGRVEEGESIHVYCSEDGLIGLKVYNHRGNGVWWDGYSRFFIWADDSNAVEFETELQARAALGAINREPRRPWHRGSIHQPAQGDSRG